MNSVRELLSERYDNNLLLMDGYDAAITGVVSRFGQEPIACYDMSKVIEISMGMGMTEEDAVENFYFNQIGSYVGESTPCFIELVENM